MAQDKKRIEIEKRIDILEDDIADIDPRILKLLIQDKTTRKNILSSRIFSMQKPVT